MASHQKLIPSDPFYQGHYRAEVFKVVYLGHDEVKPDKQLGTIKVRNRKYHHYIYNVDNADMSKSSIKHGDQLTLTGPTLRSIACPSGYLVIEVDLFCGAYKDSIRVVWLPSSRGDECNHVERRIVSKDGTGEISILFGMFFNATEALIEVSLLTEDNYAVDVGGVVAARTSKIESTGFSSLLFSKQPGYKIRVQSGEPIPLSRSIIAVPLGYKLFLDIDLFSDNESVKIVEGTLEFDASIDGTHYKTLLGKKCEIKAKVIWNFEHESKGILNDICYYSDEACED